MDYWTQIRKPIDLGETGIEDMSPAGRTQLRGQCFKMSVYLGYATKVKVANTENLLHALGKMEVVLATM